MNTLKIDSKDLSSLVKPLVSITKSRSLPTIMSCVLLQKKGATLSLLAGNNETEIQQNYELPAELIADDFSVAIPAAKLSNIISTLADELTITINDDADKAEITCKKSKFKLALLPSNDYPNTPEITTENQLTIDAEQLKTLFVHIIDAVGVEDVRYYLNGILFQIENKNLTLAGTDGHRMNVEVSDIDCNVDATIIVPRNAITQFIKVFDKGGDVNIVFDDNHIQFSDGSTTLTSKLIDGDFPEWKNVIPELADRLIEIDTDILKQALTRVSILSNEKYKGVALKLTRNQLSITARNSYQEEAEETLEVEYTGEDMEIGFNSVYLLDAIKHFSDKCKLSIIDNDSSGLFTNIDDDSLRTIVMPMRL